MDYRTHDSMVRYYAQRTDDELAQDKADIKKYLLTVMSADIEKMKSIITIINTEIETRRIANV